MAGRTAFSIVAVGDELTAFDRDNLKFAGARLFNTGDDDGHRIEVFKRMPDDRLTWQIQRITKEVGDDTEEIDAQMYDPIQGQTLGLLYEGPRAMWLPMGPVNVLSSSPTDSGIEGDEMSFQAGLRWAPAYVLCNAEGDDGDYEVVDFVHSHINSAKGGKKFIQLAGCVVSIIPRQVILVLAT